MQKVMKIENKKAKNKISLLKRIGPGFITGAADDDPSGIATYSQTGAQFGYSQSWFALFSFPFMVAIQEMCGRIGLVTGSGLSGVIRKHYSKYVLYFAVFILVVANVINIGADLGAMAATAQMLFGLPFYFWILAITVITLILEIFISYKKYSKFLKFLTLSLLTYIAAAFVIKQDWSKILLTTFIPTITFTKEYFLNIVALLGTTISPYLFFWQASEEAEEAIEQNKMSTIGGETPKTSAKDIKKLQLDTIVGMFFSNLIAFFIIIVAASTLNVGGIASIESAADAAEALRPLAGNLAYVLFTIGIIGTGLLAVPILAGSASYAVSEAIKWKSGLYLKFNEAHGFYGVITAATLLGLLVNFIHIPPFKMLYYTAALNGIVAPPLIILILLISNNKNVMGKFTNSKLQNILGIAIAFFMTAAVLAFFLL